MANRKAEPPTPQQQYAQSASTPVGYDGMEQGPLLQQPRPTMANPLGMTMTGTGEVKGSASSRVFYLRIIDSRKWHYTEAFALLVDLVVQMLSCAFLPKTYLVPSPTGGLAVDRKYFSDMKEAVYARYVSSGCMVFYIVALFLRLCGLRSALLRSRSNIADFLVILLMGATIGARYYPKFKPYEFDATLGYICLAALRLVLKPRARTFSKKLHKFRANGDHIRISIESLRASLARIPDISALAIEKMETDLLIICGRDQGDMSRDELMSFLERALRYRPHSLSATDFLAHLRDIDATTSQVVYSVGDVVHSTFGHWSNQVVDLFFCFIVVCVNAAISPGMAYFLARLSYAFTTIWRNNADENVFNEGVLGLLALSIPFVVGDYAIGYFQSKMIAKATERMQNTMLSIVLRQNTDFFQERSEGDLNNVFASDIARVNALWQAVFWNLFNPAISVSFGFAYAIYMKYPIGVMAIAFTFIILTSGPQGKAGIKSKQFAMKNAYVAADFQNAISCEKVIRAYRVQDTIVGRFKASCVTLRQAQFSKDFWSSIVQIYIESAMFIFTVVMSASLSLKVWNAALYPEDAILVGDFFAYMVLLQRVSNPVTTLGGFMRVAINNAGSLQRVDDIILGLGQSTKNNDSSDKNLPSLSKMTKELKLEKIFFKYEKASDRPYVLADLSATIPSGSYTCIVGPSGCGKSTLLACLMQFQQIDGGAIRLDTQDIFNFSKASFMNQTAVVFQDGGILNGTIYDNIRYGNINATDAECEEAARAAECHFISDLKDGYNTIVGQHALTGLSGGQAQRLCLARALCRKPSLLLLDEATSALDPETEASIVSTLERLASKMNMTIISVTHRLATTMNADQILVMNQGRVAEEGRYDDLVRKGGLFADMINNHTDSNDNNNNSNNNNSNNNNSIGPAATPSAVMKPTPVRHTSVGRHQSIDTISESGQSALALQQFTRTLSSRVAATRSRQNTEIRRSGNLSLLGGDQYPDYPNRGTAMSGASHTSEEERDKYFVL